MDKYIETLLSQLTLEEKISMIHGATLFRTAPVERLGIPALHFSDGPMGVRGEYPDAEWRYLNYGDDLVSYLPCNSALASTWNRALARKSGSILGEEARGRGKDVILAPGINIKRHPLCGRNFEYMSEDPYLISEMVVPLVQGVQQHDVAACVKHFAANSQETERLWADSIVDEQTLQEIYYPGFKAAVDAGVHSVMGAYNLLNGEHCCTSKQLLNEVLRHDWGFDGIVVSDWGGVHDTTLAAKSGLDVEMNVSYDFDKHFMADALLEKVRCGMIPEALVDEKIRNILRTMYRLKMIGPEQDQRCNGAYNTAVHQLDALSVAEESIILLKNEENRLPLDPKKQKKVAVIGLNAIQTHAFGGGSTEIKALYEITPLLGIKKLLGGNCDVRYAPGYHIPDNGGRGEISWQADSTNRQPDWVPSLTSPPELQKKLREEALALAECCDTVIYIGGLDHNFDVEGLDRKDMQLPYAQDQLLSELLRLRPDTVVVMLAGSPVEMPWIADCKTLLWSYYDGMEGGTALANVLFGKVNPSGKLAETFIQTPDQCPAKTFGEKLRVEYSEGAMVGYRYYDAVNAPVNFCFGHGLSYTSFTYTDMAIDRMCVHLKVKNTGDVAGFETVQLYISDRSCHRLRGFDKVYLQPGETACIQFALTEADFSRYDVSKNAFVPVSGVYDVQIAASSRDIRLSQQIHFYGSGE